MQAFQKDLALTRGDTEGSRHHISKGFIGLGANSALLQ